MSKTFKKKKVLKERQTKKNIKKAKIVSAYQNYNEVYEDLLEYKKVINY